MFVNFHKKKKKEKKKGERGVGTPSTLDLFITTHR